MTKLGVASWYVDADTLGLAHVLARARPDVTYPGDSGKRHKSKLSLPPSPVQDTGIDDEDWIPVVTRYGMAIISRDKHIAQRTNEKRAVLSVGAQMFAITDSRNLHVWDMLDIVVHRWRAMEALRVERPGPFIMSIARTQMTEVSLDA